jgi:hypothetical protein
LFIVGLIALIAARSGTREGLLQTRTGQFAMESLEYVGQFVPANTSVWLQTLYLGLFLPIRGLFLWLIYPVTFVAWLLLVPVRAMRRVTRGQRHPSFRQYVTCVDSAFIVLLNRTVLRAFGGSRDWPKWPAYGDTRPRTSFLDAL